MIITKYKFIPVMLLILSCCIHPANAQFFKKKKNAAADTAVTVSDTTAALKDTAVAVKDNAKAVKTKIVKVKPPMKQDTAFIPGDNQLSFGYGIGVLDADVIRWAYQVGGATANLFGPLYLKFEHAIDYQWTLGINIAYGHYRITTPSFYGTGRPHYEYRTDDTYSFLGRLNYHLEMINRFDPYLGFGLGYRISSSAQRTSDGSPPSPESYDNNFPVGFEMTGGVRYVISKNTSLYAELGLAKSALQIGFTYKMK